MSDDTLTPGPDDTVIDGGGGNIKFMCPSCHIYHALRYSDDGEWWSWNRDRINPTFGPSIKCEGVLQHNDQPFLCHSYIEGGFIRFLGDTTTELANQMVRLPPAVSPTQADTDLLN